jgi:MoxR-like ATPase
LTVQAIAQTLADNIQKVLVGKDQVVELTLIALLCEGHLLLEDVPGIGKTTLAKAIARSLHCSFARIQFTPDLLPSDINGISYFNQGSQTFEFRAGPILNQIILADEINRATPRTQSALLEAMGERQVTVDGVTHELERPFFVLATQNPVEYEGTFPLPEAQLDRFFMKLSMGYLDEASESQMLLNLGGVHPIEALTAVVDGHKLPQLSRQVWQVHVDETLRQYIVRLVFATRRHKDLVLGASPRGSHALYRGSQAYAAMNGRDYVLPDDVKKLAPTILAHRCLLHPESALRGLTAANILNNILKETELDIGEL